MTLLTLNDVSKSFGPVTAVDGASFSVDRGQVVGFLGPNGAGKSTTMRIINQLFEPDSGDILFDGEPLSEVAREAKRRIGYLPENNPLYGEMMTSEYLDFIADLRDIQGVDRVRAGRAEGAPGRERGHQPGDHAPAQGPRWGERDDDAHQRGVGPGGVRAHAHSHGAGAGHPDDRGAGDQGDRVHRPGHGVRRAGRTGRALHPRVWGAPGPARDAGRGAA